MLTPQQIQDISFEKALFGGYDMDSVDDILEPLTEDYALKPSWMTAFLTTCFSTL